MKMKMQNFKENYMATSSQGPKRDLLPVVYFFCFQFINNIIFCLFPPSIPGTIRSISPDGGMCCVIVMTLKRMNRSLLFGFTTMMFYI